MGIFDSIKAVLDGIFQNFQDDDWIEWVAQPNDLDDDCDKFNGCWFIYKQMPKYPQHYNCKCRLKKITKPIPNVTAHAICDVRKFSDYIFNPETNNGKQEIFEE